MSQAAEANSQRSPSFASGLARSSLPALLVSIAVAVWCRSATGPTLGLFLGGLMLATLIVPPLALAERTARTWLPALAVVLGIAIVWATCLKSADVTSGEWLECCLALAAYVLALTGVATLLATLGIPRAPAGALTILPGLLWLTWPVWLSPWLTQTMADWLVPANPVFAINTVLQHLGTWDRAPIAYRLLSSLNQDVPYRLPRGIAPECSAHAIIGMAALLLAMICGSARRTTSRATIES